MQKSGNITKLEDILKEEVDPGIPEIKHFMYKSKTTAQFLTSCDKSYEDLEKKKRLKNIYFVLKKRLLSLNRPVKLLYFSGSHESAIAWVRKFLWKCFTKFFFHIWFFFQATIHFEVYATFDPITEKNDAFAAANKLIKWAKKEESNLFILSSPTF